MKDRFHCCQTSNISSTKSQNLNVSHFVLQFSIRWSQVLSREWRCNWSSADRRCSNYIWVINNFIAQDVPYIRSFTVIFFHHDSNSMEIHFYCKTFSGSVIATKLSSYYTSPAFVAFANLLDGYLAWYVHTFTCICVTISKSLRWFVYKLKGKKIFLHLLNTMRKILCLKLL